MIDRRRKIDGRSKRELWKVVKWLEDMMGAECEVVNRKFGEMFRFKFHAGNYTQCHCFSWDDIAREDPETLLGLLRRANELVHTDAFGYSNPPRN